MSPDQRGVPSDHPVETAPGTPAPVADESSALAGQSPTPVGPSHNPSEFHADGSGSAPVWLLLAAPPWSAPARPSRTVLAELQRRHSANAPLVRSALLDDLGADALAALGVTEVPTWLVVKAVTYAGRAGAVTSTGDESPHAGAHGDATTTPTTPTFHHAAEVLRGICGELPASLEWTITDRRVGARPKYELEHDLWQPHLDPGEASTVSNR